MPVLIAATALLGLAIGSFLNVVIHRVPISASLSHPPSRCPFCEHPIRARHNLPVFGWLVLRGRCADCAEPISIRYPLVELSCAALFVLLTLRMSSLHLLAALPAYLWFAAIAIALAMIDIDHHRLPNSIVLPSYPVLALLLTLAAVVTDSPAAAVRMVIGAMALFIFYFLLMLSYPKGMGYGDVKLAGLLGGLLSFLSYSTLLVGAFGGFLLGGIAGLALMVSGRGNGKTKIPFGPFMLAGALLAIFFAAPVSRVYLNFVTGA
ncbi:A24 family peptidase [soil metagenome]